MITQGRLECGKIVADWLWWWFLWGYCINTEKGNKACDPEVEDLGKGYMFWLRNLKSLKLAPTSENGFTPNHKRLGNGNLHFIQPLLIAYLRT